MNKPIAIVGISFHLPGATTHHFDSALQSGTDSITQVEASRWEQRSYLHPERKHSGSSYTFAAGSIGDVKGFDASFFGISPREATLMDPQQRKLLEWSWEAFENAGIAPSSIRGSDCGVYIGIASADYSYRMADDLAAVDASSATGNTASIAANRLSYFYDLRGPSMAIDTACSSSLVAFHQACQAIRSGETRMALAGGVSLHLHPYGFVVFSKASMLSRSGRCNVFDADGDGYVRSEGGGIVILKDYDAAVADGDPILAIVAGSAVNTDGRKTGLTVPSDQAQADLLRQAYTKAGIKPDEIDYLEAHGTGTAIGDPIETRAIGKALGQARKRKLLIGSVKSNVGHLETASGIAGLAKALYTIKHRQIPATIGIKTLNPKIDFQALNLEVVTQNTPLKARGKLTVGVNSFGFGGANAHIILQSPDAAPKRKAISKTLAAQALPIVLTAKSTQALTQGAAALSARAAQGDANLYDLAFSLTQHRDWHEHRAVAYCRTVEEVATRFAAFAAGTAADAQLSSGTVLPQASGVAFVYSGNGSQWYGMGRVLLQQSTTFRQAVEEVDRHFLPLGGFSLLDELAGTSGEDRYAYTEIAQPALFALQVGLTCMLREMGITAQASMGHSVGEIAAAWCSGALSLADATRVIYHRSHLQGLTKGLGRMAAVGLGEAAALAQIQELGLDGRICITGVNSSRGVTVAGTVQDLAVLESAVLTLGKFYRRLDLDYAFHSPAMDGIEAQVIAALDALQPQASAIPFYSTVSGTCCAGSELDQHYWWHNVRQPVLFEAAAKSMIDDGITLFVEIGPHTVLRSYLADSLKDSGIEGRIVATLTREDAHPGKISQAAQRVLVAGGQIDRQRLFPVQGRFLPLPNYAWQRENLWHPVTPESMGLLERKQIHPLLGHALKQHRQTWENTLDTALLPMLADHIVGDAVVFPGTAYLEMALAAARAQHDAEVFEIEALEIQAPLLLSEGKTRLLRTRIEAADGSLSIQARDYAGSDNWTLHAKARIRPEPVTLRLQQDRLEIPLQQPNFSASSHQALTQLAGLDYGPAFCCVQQGWADGTHALAALCIPEEISNEINDYLLHPALLDCTFQLIIQLLRDEVASMAGIAFVPTRIGRITCRTGAGVPAYARASLLQRAPHSLSARFAIFDQAGVVIAVIEEARFRSVRLRKHDAETLLPLDYRCEPAPLPQQIRNTLSAAQLQSSLQSLLAELPAMPGGADYASEVDPLLDSLASHYTLEALQDCAKNGVLSTDAELDNTVAQSRYRASLALAEADQTIIRTKTGWQIDPDAASEVSAREIWNLLAADYPEYFSLVHAISLGSQMTQSLLNAAPVQLALPSFDSVWSATLGTARQAAMSTSLARMLNQHLQHLPAGQRFALLEVGAGAPLWAHAALQSLDFSRSSYCFAAENDTRRAELAALQEQHPDLRIVTRDSHVSACHLAIVNLDYPDLNAARQAIEYAQAHLLPDGVLLLVGRHRSRWLANIYPEQYQQPANSAHYWQAQLKQAGWSCEALLETAPDTLSDLFFMVASRPVGEPVQAQAQAQQILLLADQLPAGLEHLLQTALHTAGVPAQVAVQLCTADSVSALLSERQDLSSMQQIVYLQGLFAAQDAQQALDRVAVQTQRCHGLVQLLKTCEQSASQAAVWVITHGAATAWIDGNPASSHADSALWGFGRTVLNEFPDRQVRLLDLAGLDDLALLASLLAREICHANAEQEIVLDAQGLRYVPRMHVRTLAAAKTDDEHARLIRLGFQFPGQLRNLRWESVPATPLAPDQLEVEVRATGLNFRDVMYALGLLSDEAVENGFAGPSLGLEFAGVVRAVGAQVQAYRPGDQVVGFGPYSFANRTLTSESAIAPIPPGISFEAAATIPSVFLTVYYALCHLAQLQPGEKILIHGAAGGVGIAAIQMARHLGAEIYATAGSAEKRAFLRNMGVTHIYDSRSLDFADEILLQTGGSGVDVVLNSLAGEAVNRNFDVLKPFGRFLELGKRDFYENTKIGLRPFRNNISYFGIDADQLMQVRPDLTRRLFGEVMQLFADRTLSPLPYQSFPAEQVIDAFRHMQQARQIGKIVVTYYHDLARLPVAQPTQKPALHLSQDARYLVTGGLGGFGLQTAKWLVEKGARHLVLLSRSGPASTEAQEAIAQMCAQGVTVDAHACDITSLPALEAVFAEIKRQGPPLRGIVHAAVVIDDGLIQNLTAEQIERVLRPKMLGADYLDALSADMALDFFVLYSSATTLFGNPGQASYVAANSYLEALAMKRRARGLAATCVRWGAIDDVGFLARNTRIKDALQGRMGGQALNSATALAYLEQMLLDDVSGIGLMELDWRALARFLPSAATPKFSHLAQAFAGHEQEADTGLDIQQLLTELDDEALQQTFVNMLKHEVGNILRIPAEKIDASASIYDMGLDSLMGVELVLALEERFGTRLPVMALSESPNIGKLAERLIVQMRGQSEPSNEEDQALAQLQQIAAQHGVSINAQDEEQVRNMAQGKNASRTRMID